MRLWLALLLLVPSLAAAETVTVTVTAPTEAISVQQQTTVVTPTTVTVNAVIDQTGTSATTIAVPGPQGPKGVDGVIGMDGAPGVDGHSPALTWTGDQIAIDGAVSGPHLTGPAGANGASGPQGIQGIQGATGPQGPAGATGPQGPRGYDGWDGSVILVAAGAPVAGLGKNGDYYKDSSNGDWYLKTADAWVLKGNDTGPQGPQGPEGLQGSPDTPAMIRDKIGTPEDGQILRQQQGPTEAATASKFEIRDNGSNTRWYHDGTGSAYKKDPTGVVRWKIDDTGLHGYLSSGVEVVTFSVQ